MYKQVAFNNIHPDELVEASIGDVHIFKDVVFFLDFTGKTILFGCVNL